MMFISEVMEWPHPHTHVAVDRSVTQRVTQQCTTLLLAPQPQSNNDDITELMVTCFTLESTTNNVIPNTHCLSLSGVCSVCCVRGQQMKTIWVNMSSWLCWWRKVPNTSWRDCLMITFEPLWKMCVLIFTSNRWWLGQELLSMSWSPIRLTFFNH